MKSKAVVGAIVTGALLLGVVGSANNGQDSDLNTNTVDKTSSKAQIIPVEKAVITCDGTAIIGDCEVEGIKYKTYIYRPATPEKTHNETTTTYREEITGYCTLCNDGTYSPSCATGRGACSHHGGVAQWNAPRVSQVPVQETRVVVDAPAKEGYYEKIESDR